MKNLDLVIQKCIAKDKIAQQQLYTYTYCNLSTAVAMYVNDNSKKDWLFNIGMLRIFNSLESYTLKTNYLGWARTLLVRSTIDYLRKDKKPAYNILPLDSVSYQINSQDFDNMMNKIDTEDLIKVIQTLPKNENLVFNLYEIEGYTHKEIEEHTGIKMNTSKWLLSKAKMSLKNKIEHSFITKRYGYGSK